MITGKTHRKLQHQWLACLNRGAGEVVLSDTEASPGSGLPSSILGEFLEAPL